MNSAWSSLRMLVNGNLYGRATEGEVNPVSVSGNTNRAWRSETVVWLGQLSANDRVKFELQVDNGWNNNHSDGGQNCYTITNVD